MVNKKRHFKVPHTLIIISIILVLTAIATYFVPGGIYERIINEAGREVVVPGSFEFISSNPQNIFDILVSPIRGIEDASHIIGFLFIVGGSIALISKTNAINLGISRVVHKLKGKEILIIPTLIFLFSLGGAIFGMAEEAVPFVLVLAPLMLALGYDSLVTIGVTYLATVVGFATAMLNPFNVGVAQGIAGLPLFSGVTYRTLIWIIMTLVVIIYVVRHALKVKKNPMLSPVYELDLERKEEYKNVDMVDEHFTNRHRLIIVLLFVCIGIIVWGVLTQGFYVNEISAVFLATGILSSIVAKFSPDTIAKNFIEGAKDYIGAAIMIGLARSIVILAEDAMIIDTVLYYLSTWISELPTILSALLLLPVHMFINFFVVSGSGQAALTMPVLVPLGDLIGINSQLSVLIFQLGDGFTNALYPTSGILIACLSLAKIPYSKWFKFVIPLQGIFFVLSLLFIAIAYYFIWVG